MSEDSFRNDLDKISSLFEDLKKNIETHSGLNEQIMPTLSAVGLMTSANIGQECGNEFLAENFLRANRSRLEEYEYSSKKYYRLSDKDRAHWLKDRSLSEMQGSFRKYRTPTSDRFEALFREVIRTGRFDKIARNQTDITYLQRIEEIFRKASIRIFVKLPIKEITQFLHDQKLSKEQFEEFVGRKQTIERISSIIENKKSEI